MPVLVEQSSTNILFNVLFVMKLLLMYVKYEHYHIRYSLSVPCTV